MIINIYNAFLIHVRLLWDSWNELTHDINPSNHIGYKCLMLLTKVQNLYHKSESILAQDCHLFDEPLEQQ